MKTVIIKEALLQVVTIHQQRHAILKAVLIKRLINESTGASQQSDNSLVVPHQALPSAESIRRIRMIYEYQSLIIL